MTKLGPAEQFLLLLLALPGYAMRIKATIMVENISISNHFSLVDCTIFKPQKIDFHPSMAELEPPLRLILMTCHDLIANKSLQDFMAVVLQLGNYLNSVQFN